MILIIFLPLIAALLLYLEAPWWLQGIGTLPSVLFATGYGWANRISQNPHKGILSTLIDASWISLCILWLNISILREFGVVQQAPVLIFLTALWTYTGAIIGWKKRYHKPMLEREKVGIIAIIFGIMFLGFWKANDIMRPLDGYWYQEGADDPRNQRLALRPGRNWSYTEDIGWSDAGAMVLYPQNKNPDLIATAKVHGRLTLAVRGPMGSYIEAGGKKAVVEQYVTEKESEGPVRRYLDKGVASISIWVDLQPGEYFGLDVQGEEVYLIPSADAVWSLHSTGRLQFIHYYQILNQVENQVWAQEVLSNRRYTWNQPPGWSPILAASTILVADDLNGASILLLWVLSIIGLSSLRLCLLIAPYAHTSAFVLPAFFVIIHGQLMLLPASMNFPDSLYTAAILGVFIGLLENNERQSALLGFASQALRWPGGVLAIYFWTLKRKLYSEKSSFRFLKILGSCIAIFGLIAIVTTQSNDAGKIFDILYFETFPEHWHDNYAPFTLLARIPSFFAHWILYTGGSLLLVIPFLYGPDREERNHLRFLMFSILPYALILGTIDHSPSHYFLPLVACTGPMLVASISLVGKRGSMLAALSICGICLYLWNDFV